MGLRFGLAQSHAYELLPLSLMLPIAYSELANEESKTFQATWTREYKDICLLE